MSSGELSLSVIVPAYQCGDTLARSLGAIRACEAPFADWELIVVDDGSADSTADVASVFADLVIRVTDGPRGPSFARNRGAEQARGRCLVFVDADVCVHTDTLRQFSNLLAREPEVSAIFGAYDTRPDDQGLVSQYRNLMHHYVHSINAGRAETFWTGCGAVERAAFIAVGMFDEKEYAMHIEDIELGYRLSDAGYGILLCPEIRATHLKKWTLSRMVATDFFDRAVPWMRLLLERRGSTRRGTLNVSYAEQLYTLLTGMALASILLAVVLADARWLLLASVCVIGVGLGNLALLRWFVRERGLVFAMRVAPLRLLSYIVSAVAAGWAIALHVRQGCIRAIQLRRVIS